MDSHDDMLGASTVRREQEFFDANGSRYVQVRKWITRSIGAFNRSTEMHTYYDPRGKVILDYGCGAGRFALELVNNGAAHVTGIDISNTRIQEATAAARAAGIADRTDFLVVDAHDTGLPEHSFDLIIGSDIIHHLDVEAAAREMKRLLKTDGAAVFIEPLAHNPLLRVGRWLTPSARTVDEHPLTTADWAMLGQIFPNFEHSERELLTIPLMPLNLALPRSMQERVAQRVAPWDDRVLETRPSLRKYARRTILVMKP
jgi:ubiquinone/menaquinone biosynthesis C-methylase UbiE